MGQLTEVFPYNHDFYYSTPETRRYPLWRVQRWTDNCKRYSNLRASLVTIGISMFTKSNNTIAAGQIGIYGKDKRSTSWLWHLAFESLY